MKTRYGELYSISLTHEHFRTGVADALRLVPTQSTVHELQRLRMRFVQGEGRAAVLVPLTTAGALAVPLVRQTRFSFLLVTDDPDLLSVTNVDLNRLKTERAYLTNLNKIAVADVLDLTTAPDAFVPSKAYRSGDLVSQGTSVLERLDDGTGGVTTDAAVWTPKQATRYVSGADLLPVSGFSTAFELPPASVFEVEVFALNIDTGAFTALAYRTRLTTPDRIPLSHVQLDLSHLPPGRYRAVINGQEFLRYLSSELQDVSRLGVVEIFHHLAVDDPYQPVDASLHPKENRYQINFASRSAYIKYVMKTDRDLSLVDVASGSTAALFSRASDGLSFSSQRPLPVRQDQDHQALTFRLGDLELRAPKPDPKAPAAFSYAEQAIDGHWTKPTFRIPVPL